MVEPNSGTLPSHPVDLPQLIDWSTQVGQIATQYFNRIETVQSKSDDTLVTPADVEIEHFLAEQIRANFPADGLISEEGSRSHKFQDSPRLWVIDPLDGTTIFWQGLSGWGTAIGLLEHGLPTFGLFYMPQINDLTYTIGQNEVYNNERDLRGAVQPEWTDRGFLAVNASAHDKFHIDIGHTRTVGGVGASLVYTARGAATAAFLPKARLWDLVAGAAILKRTGGELRYLSGRPIDYLQLLNGQLAPEPIIAGHPHILDRLSPAIRPQESAQSKN